MASPTKSSTSPGFGSPGRKKTLAPITIEDVFASVSEAKAYGNYSPKRRSVLTPNSAEACLQCGINPEELRIRDLDSFWEPSIDPKIQRMPLRGLLSITPRPHERSQSRSNKAARSPRKKKARSGFSPAQGKRVKKDQQLLIWTPSSWKKCRCASSAK